MARIDVIRAVIGEFAEGLDILVLEDGDFTGSDTVAQDKIDLADFGFDDDEIMLFYDLEVVASTAQSGIMETANDIISVILTMNKSATAGQQKADDVPFYQFFWNVLVTVAGTIAWNKNKAKMPTPVPIIDHFWLHNIWKSGGGDGSGEGQIWIYYKKVKLTTGTLRDAIRLLRMAG